MSQLMKVKIMNEKQPVKIKATSNFPPVNVGGTTDHSKLENLDYAHSGHTGFVKAEAGKTLSTNDFTNEDKAKLVSLENYTLPIASAETLGGVKIGENLNIDENGVLSASGGDSGLYWEWEDTSEKSIALFQKVYDDMKNNKKFNIITTVQWAYYKYVYVSTSCEFYQTTTNNGYLKVKFADVGRGLSSGSKASYTSLCTKYVMITITNGIATAIDVDSTLNTNILNKYDYNYHFGGLSADNTEAYTPTKDYHPATKKYVDDKLTTITGYDATKTQTLKNINGVLTWQTDGE